MRAITLTATTLVVAAARSAETAKAEKRENIIKSGLGGCRSLGRRSDENAALYMNLGSAKKTATICTYLLGLKQAASKIIIMTRRQPETKRGLTVLRSRSRQTLNFNLKGRK